jgi:hypothetical protein
LDLPIRIIENRKMSAFQKETMMQPK